MPHRRTFYCCDRTQKPNLSHNNKNTNTTMNTPIRTKILASALIGAASLLAASTTNAALMPLPFGTTEAAGVGQPLTTISPSGTYVAHLQSAFQDPNFPGVAPGLLRSLVVNTGTGYECYYQVVNLST